MDGLAQQFLEHPRRAWFLWGTVAAIGLALTLPAWESWAAASEVRATLHAERTAVEAAAARLPEVKQRFTALKEQAAGADGPRGLDDAAVEELRESVVRRIAAAGCRYRRLTLDEPVTTPWPDGPPPLPGVVRPPEPPAAKDRPPVKFELITRRLEAEAVGPPDRIAGLLKWAVAAHPYAVPLNYDLSFDDSPDTAAREVHLTFTLLLTAVQPVKKATKG
ncbi:hypothetical protein [Alienimonas sp. DA493]|uniref:hypothetical protein n=1 Tax=Alienimonas sp. DA493 TaxID=3373605 RepID=UPI00375473D6